MMITQRTTIKRETNQAIQRRFYQVIYVNLYKIAWVTNFTADDYVVPAYNDVSITRINGT